jgi:amidase
MRHPSFASSVATMKGTTETPIVGLSAVDISALVRRGQASPVEVVSAHLEQIEQLDPTLNAFQVVMAAGALEEARALQKRDDLADLPLAGVPVAVKDNLDVAGVPTRQGSAATSTDPADRDDELVARLRSAGAVVIGKTRMPELAIWPLTEPQAFGPTRNPWNQERSTGGSSGGSAVAVATGMAPVGLGSDGGGSLRVPAACCGVVGFKPTPGLVPLAGGVADHWLGLTAFGPLANTVADVGVMLNVLAGQDIVGGAPAGAGPLRVAVSTRHPTRGASVSAEVVRTVHDTAAVLSGLGHHITEADPPYPADLGIRFMRRWLAGISADADRLPHERLERRTRSMARWGRFLRRAGLAKPAASDPFRANATAWFESFDVLIMPTLAEEPVLLGKWDGKGWFSTTMGVSNWIMTGHWNLAGFPAASIPAGMSAGGLPLGVQVLAKPGADRLLLGLLQQLEAERPWRRYEAT